MIEIGTRMVQDLPADDLEAALLDGLSLGHVVHAITQGLSQVTPAWKQMPRNPETAAKLVEALTTDAIVATSTAVTELNQASGQGVFEATEPLHLVWLNQALARLLEAQTHLAMAFELKGQDDDGQEPG